MSAPDIDAAIIDRFAAIAGDAHLTLVLGAGASAPSGLPQWDEFAAKVAALSGLVASDEVARILLAKQDNTIVLEAARSFAGPRWPDVLAEALYGRRGTDAVPSPLHLAAAGHLAQLPETTTLATLNYDTLLEEAVLTAAGGVVVSWDGIDEPDVPTVHHLHGVVFPSGAYNPVVSFRDYAELVADTGAWQRHFLATALDRGPLLLAGTSYRDPDIRHWLHLLLRDGEPAHQAMVTIVREGLGLERGPFDAIKQALAAEWEAIGLSALTMEDLADVAIVIRELQFVGTSGYQPPRERARRIWAAHEARFRDLQHEYSQALGRDSAKVAAALKASAHRATLWLADGDGRLARWATDGHIYATAGLLKHVPTGHDSPWIAGEALAAEEVKLVDVHRQRGVSPSWESVLAIPVFVGGCGLPEIAAAVITFGMEERAVSLLERQDDWASLAEHLSSEWGSRLASVLLP
ncbi:SIR2 family protein [Agrococcus sp. TSP3-2-1]|uniref:SIR2 family protein n=1 Tax=Agrococcus sp. TSP3-2-1 TaxID=2804583 RepID=UPI003CF084BE